MTGAQAAGLVALSMSLLLALNNLSGQRVPIGRTAKMALVWVIVIAGLAYLVDLVI